MNKLFLIQFENILMIQHTYRKYIYEVVDLPPEMLANKTLFLYGCGKAGKELNKKLRLSGLRLPELIYIDDYSKASVVDESPVVPFKEVESNYENTIITNRFLIRNPEFSNFPQYILDLPHDQTTTQKGLNAENITSVLQNLNDELSQSLYQVLIDLRKNEFTKRDRFTGLHSVLNRFPFKQQYCEFIPDDLGYVVDGGFLDGESSRAIIKNRSYQKVFGFDPQARLGDRVDKGIEMIKQALGRSVSKAYF